MVPLTPVQKISIISITLVSSFIFGFSSGYSYRANIDEINRLKQFEAIQTKIDKVYKFSQDQSLSAITNANNINEKLGSILGKVKPKVLSSKPCEPSDEFYNTWREIDNVKDVIITK